MNVKKNGTKLIKTSLRSAMLGSLVEGTNSSSGIQLFLEIVCIYVKCLFAIVSRIVYFFKERRQKSVAGEIVLVTGAGHGIGKELAKKYASEGATVVCWDINKLTNEETVREIAALGYPKAYAYLCDVSKSEEVEKVSKQVQNEVGCITILVNNAGIGMVKPILEMDSSEIQNMIRVNTLSHFWTMKAFLPGMLRNNHGHIVAICSIAGLFGARNGTLYCASKFALHGMMEALYQDLRANPTNKINISIIYPSGVNTGIFKKAKARFPRLLPIITSREAADQIVKAQKQRLIYFSIPSYTLVTNHLLRFLPMKVQDRLTDFFDTYVVE